MGKFTYRVYQKVRCYEMTMLSMERADVAQVMAAIVYADFELVPKLDQVPIVNQFLTNLGENYEYTGEYRELLEKEYARLGQNLPLQVLVTLMQVGSEYDFIADTPNHLTLREVLGLLDAAQIQALHQVTSQEQIADTCHSIMQSFETKYLEMMPHMDTVIGLRLKDFEAHNLPLAEMGIKAQLQAISVNGREKLVDALTLIIQARTADIFIQEYFRVFTEHSADYLKDCCFVYAHQLEDLAKAVFRTASITKLKEQYPHIQQLVNLDVVLNEFLNASSNYADTEYHMGMDWVAYSEKLANLYEDDRYKDLTRAMKKEVLNVYSRTIGVKAMLMTESVGNSIAGVSSRLAQKFIVATRLDKVYRLSQGAVNVTSAVCRSINTHIIQRGFRTVNLMSEMVKGEVANQAKKRGKWGNDHSQGLISQAITEELLASENLDEWMEQVENNANDPLYQAVKAHTQNVCDDVDANGLEQLQKRLAQASVNDLKAMLELELLDFSQRAGYQFNLPALYVEYEETLLNRYYDSLLDAKAMEKQAVIQDLVIGVGYRIAHRHIVDVQLLESEKSYIAQQVELLYQQARDKDIHYSVPTQDYYTHVGGDQIFKNVKRTVPIAPNHASQLNKAYVQLIHNTLEHIPKHKDVSEQTLTLRKEYAEKLLNALENGAVALTLKDGSIYTATRHTHFWALGKLNAPSEIQLEKQQDMDNIYREIGKADTAIRMFDLEKAQWIRIPFMIVTSFKVVHSQINVTMFTQLYTELLRSLYSNYTLIAKQAGFRLDEERLKFDTLLAYAMHVVQESPVHLHEIQGVLEDLTKQTIASCVTHALFTERDREFVHQQLKKYIADREQAQQPLEVDVSTVLQQIDTEVFCHFKVVFEQEKTIQGYYKVIQEAIEQLEGKKPADNLNRFDQAIKKVQQAIGTISDYTRQDQETYQKLLYYAQTLQKEFQRVGDQGTINLEVDQGNYLIKVAFENDQEVFMLHPQFIINAISHKVYADRTGVMQFERAFTSEFDQFLGQDISSLAALITARRKQDYEQKQLSEQDVIRMKRFKQMVIDYQDNMKELDLKFAFLERNGEVQQCKMYVKGVESYLFNPLFILDIPKNMFVFQRENPGATLSELMDQFLRQNDTHHLSKVQMQALNALFLTAFDLRKNYTT